MAVLLALLALPSPLALAAEPRHMQRDLARGREYPSPLALAAEPRRMQRDLRQQRQQLLKLSQIRPENRLRRLPARMRMPLKV